MSVDLLIHTLIYLFGREYIPNSVTADRPGPRVLDIKSCPARLTSGQGSSLGSLYHVGDLLGRRWGLGLGLGCGLCAAAASVHISQLLPTLASHLGSFMYFIIACMPPLCISSNIGFSSGSSCNMRLASHSTLGLLTCIFPKLSFCQVGDPPKSERSGSEVQSCVRKGEGRVGGRGTP